MAHSHECGCNHNLKYCNCCDKVYCTKCGKEWGNGWYYPAYSYPTYPSYPYVTYTNAGDSVQYSTSNASSCHHL